MKTTFDLPEPLLRRAKAAAAHQGRPLRDLVAEAIADKLGMQAAAQQRRSEPAPAEWAAVLATLVRQPDGTYVNPNGIEDEGFFDELENIRSGRLAEQARLFPAPKRSAASALKKP